jgi:hypothetical protein
MDGKKNRQVVVSMDSPSTTLPSYQLNYLPYTQQSKKVAIWKLGCPTYYMVGVKDKGRFCLQLFTSSKEASFPRGNRLLARKWPS